MSFVFLFILCLAIIGVPFFVVLGLLSLTSSSLAGMQTTAVVGEIYKIITVPTFLSLPLFAFAGATFDESKPSGFFGGLFAPILCFLLLALNGQLEVVQSFWMGVIPGLLLVAVWLFFKGHSFKSMSSVFILLFIVCAGICSQLLTITEVAAFSAVYMFVLEFVIRKKIKLVSALPHIVGKSMSWVGAVLLIWCCSLGLISYLVEEEFFMKFSLMAKELIYNKFVFLSLLVLVLILVGSFVNFYVLTLLSLPFIIPFSNAFEVQPSHLGDVILMGLLLGQIVPVFKRYSVLKSFFVTYSK